MRHIQCFGKSLPFLKKFLCTPNFIVWQIDPIIKTKLNTLKESEVASSSSDSETDSTDESREEDDNPEEHPVVYGPGPILLYGLTIRFHLFVIT